MKIYYFPHIHAHFSFLIQLRSLFFERCEWPHIHWLSKLDVCFEMLFDSDVDLI